MFGCGSLGRNLHQTLGNFKVWALLFIVGYILFVISTLKLLVIDAPSFTDLDESSSRGKCKTGAREATKPMFTLLTADIYLTNVYYDDRIGKFKQLRILGVAGRSYHEDEENTFPRIYCVLESTKTSSIVAVPASKITLRLDNDYEEFLLSCPVSNYVDTNPCDIRVSYDKERMAEASVSLQVHDIGSMQVGMKKSIAVCSPPMGDTIQPVDLLEFVELSLLLGSEHVYLYKTKLTNPKLDSILDYYENVADVTIHQWDPPTMDISYSPSSNAVTLALHHCLYTNMIAYDFVVFNELHEFIFASQVMGWKQLLKVMDDGSFSAFCFQSAYYAPDPMTSLRSLGGTDRTLARPNGTRCMVRPKHIVTLALQYPQTFFYADHSVYDIDENEAICHRYEKCPDTEDKEICSYIWQDNYALYYRDDLINKYYDIKLEADL